MVCCPCNRRIFCCSKVETSHDRAFVKHPAQIFFCAQPRAPAPKQQLICWHEHSRVVRSCLRSRHVQYSGQLSVVITRVCQPKNPAASGQDFDELPDDQMSEHCSIGSGQRDLGQTFKVKLSTCCFKIFSRQHWS